MGKDTPRREDTHAGGVAPVCGGADRGRGARRSAALVSESLRVCIFKAQARLMGRKIRKQRICTPYYVPFRFDCIKVCPLIWIVFDRDRVTNFDGIIEQAKREGVNVGWSNPCIEIWFDAYFGKIHSYIDSVTCCRKFGETFKQRTGQEYHKDSRQIYAVLNRFGDEVKAIRIAESRLQGHLKDGIGKPSEMCPCTTVHTLVNEIQQKTRITNT